MVLKVSLNTGINRIRLEFKGIGPGDTQIRPECINRIRLEFKGCSVYFRWMTKVVLIESDWNLKIILSGIVQQDSSVLIESDWNLKVFL